MVFLFSFGVGGGADRRACAAFLHHEKIRVTSSGTRQE